MREFCYADDIGLLSRLKDIIKICERYAHKYKIHFNAIKSQLLCFNTSVEFYQLQVKTRRQV